jgi:hypothetical protein
MDIPHRIAETAGAVWVLRYSVQGCNGAAKGDLAQAFYPRGANQSVMSYGENPSRNDPLSITDEAGYIYRAVAGIKGS